MTSNIELERISLQDLKKLVEEAKNGISNMEKHHRHRVPNSHSEITSLKKRIKKTHGNNRKVKKPPKS